MHVLLKSNDNATSHSAKLVRPIALAILVALAGMAASGLAQAPASPTQERPVTTSTSPTTPVAPVPQQTPDSQADVEWLTAYMLAHEGYQLKHLPSLEQSFEKLSPTHLHTLREFYEQKHAMVMQQQALIHQLQAQQVNMAEAYQQRQQRALDQFTQEESQAADAETRQINQMHEEAAANAAAYRLYGPRIYPSPGYGGYPYGPWGGPRYPY